MLYLLDAAISPHNNLLSVMCYLQFINYMLLSYSCRETGHFVTIYSAVSPLYLLVHEMYRRHIVHLVLQYFCYSHIICPINMHIFLLMCEICRRDEDLSCIWCCGIIAFNYSPDFCCISYFCLYMTLKM